jgi:hypothetical protein
MIIPQDRTRPFYLPNTIWTVAITRGSATKGAPKLIRYREREFPFHSILSGNYHTTQVDSPYGVGPCVMGAPVHKAGTRALNSTMIASMLSALPPISYNPDDPYMEMTGGPVLEPQAKFQSQSGVEVLKITDPRSLLEVMVTLMRLYENVTGVNQPRLGTQTKSHTTAFAKDAELSRSEMRTVSFAVSLMTGFLPNFLSMEFAMAGAAFDRDTNVYIPKYQDYVTFPRDLGMPELATFEVYGAAGPLEKREREAQKNQSLTLALQIETVKAQMQRGTPLDLDEMQKVILEHGGFIDIERFFAERSEAGLAGAAADARARAGVALVSSKPTRDELIRMAAGQE